jgi:hypothetical protein
MESLWEFSGSDGYNGEFEALFPDLNIEKAPYSRNM